MKFSFKWDKKTVDRVVKQLDAVEKCFDEGGKEGVTLAVAEILRLALAIVPFREGILASTGRSTSAKEEANGRIMARILFGTVYAAAQHERTDYVHLNGRLDHYVERPLLAQGPQLLREKVRESILRRLQQLSAKR